MSRHRSLRALLVDVPAGHAELLVQALEDAGWRVKAEAVRGADALTAALHRRGWQAVLYGGDGRGAVPAHKARALARLADPHMPFIAVSPYVRAGDLAAVIRGLDGSVPVVEEPARLPRVLDRELDRARLRRRVGGAHRLLLAQQAITDHVAAGLDLDELCARVLATLGETLGWSYGAVWRPDEETGVLRCRPVWHAASAGPDVVAFAAHSRELALASGRGLPGRVWAFRRPAWIADVARDPNMPRARAALQAGLTTAVAFPLALADECHGVIEFFAPGIHEPNAEVAAMFTTVGGQLAQYLDRRRADLEANRGMDSGLGAHARALLDAAAVIVVALDREGRVTLAGRRACELLGRGEEELVGGDWFAAAVPQTEREHARSEFRALLGDERGDACEIQHPLAASAGPPRPTSWRWALLRDADRKPSGMLAWGEADEPPPSPSGAAAVVAELAAALAARPAPAA